MLRGAGSAAALAAVGYSLEGVGRPARVPRIASFATQRTTPARAFRSRPDLHPPAVTASVELPDNDDAARFLFLGPGPQWPPPSPQPISQYGPLIVDARGEPVWFRRPSSDMVVSNFAPSSYRGRPVLIWWEGKILSSGYGQGEGVIVDSSYREIARVRAANGRVMDLHEFHLTRQGTALITCYPDVVPADLSSLGGPRNGRVFESIIQEVDVASGRLLMEWRSLGHVPVADSYHQLGDPHDYLHANSVQRTADGNLLVSGRHTWALYKLAGRGGDVLWQLGGKRSQFDLGPGTDFSWQHDARQISDRVLTLFDNGYDGVTQTQSQSRGLMLTLDERRGAVELGAAYTDPGGLLAGGMGSVQVLSSGRVVVCWGTAPYISQFEPNGRLIKDSKMPDGLYSYRGSLAGWTGVPDYPPAIVTHRDSGSGAELVYASWNGATEQTSWRIDAGFRADDLRPVGIAARRGFETVIPIDPRFRYASVTALDAGGRRLGHSGTIAI